MTKQLRSIPGGVRQVGHWTLRSIQHPRKDHLCTLVGKHDNGRWAINLDINKSEFDTFDPDAFWAQAKITD